MNHNEECYSGLEILSRLAQKGRPVILGDLAGCNLGDNNKNLDYYVCRGIVIKKPLGTAHTYELSGKGAKILDELISDF